jgi:uncharacterized coiled-coil DUF342 family protein
MASGAARRSATTLSRHAFMSCAMRSANTGFVAQEVEQAANELNYAFSGVDAPKNENDFYGLRYAEFVVPLAKAVQELHAENTQMKRDLRELKELLEKLMKDRR